MRERKHERLFSLIYMKSLLPSLKEKKRYLAFEIVSENKFNKNEVKESIVRNCLRFMGEFNYGKAGITMASFNNNKGIIKINNKFVDHLKASLILIRSIKNKKVGFKTLGVSGIIKKAKNNYMLEEGV